MRKTTLIPVALILAGCVNGIQIGGGRPTQSPAFGVGSFADSPYTAPMRDFQAQFDPVKRNDPNEKPRIVKVAVAEGKTVNARVFAENCVNGGPYALENDVYLCGRPMKEKHELDHVRGMTHTPWVRTAVGGCATIIKPGYNTGYKAGHEICFANDYEVSAK